MFTKSAGIFNKRNGTQVSPYIKDVENFEEHNEFSQIILEDYQNCLSNFHARRE